MPIGTPQGNLDIKNATLRTSNLETQNIKIGSIFVGTGVYSLEETANVGNSMSNTIQFTNTHTGFVTTSNVGIGTNTPLDTLHINGGTLFAGHIIPTTNATFDIGSAEKKVRDLYVDTNSLWVGDTTKIAFSGGKMKFKRRKVNQVPRMLVTLATSQSNELSTESEVQSDAVTFAQTIDASISTVSDLKLEHWRDYAKRFDTTKSVSDIFADNDDDYEAVTASEAFMEVGSNIFTEHSLSIGKTTDPTATLDIYKEDTTAAGQTVISSITGVFSGSDATGGNINNTGLFIDLDSSATGGTATNTEEHRVWGIDVDIDVTGDSDDIRGGRFLVRSELAANGSDQNTNIWGVDAQGQHNGSAPNTNIIGVNARSFKGSDSTGLTTNMIGVAAEYEINTGTCTDAYGVRARFDRNGGAVTNSYLFYGDHIGSTTTITNNYGLYVTGADRHYLEGNVGIGTDTPVYKLDVNGEIQLRGQGFIYHANETSDSAAARFFLRFNKTLDASYPMLCNRTPGGDVVIATGTSSGGGDVERMRFNGGDGTRDIEVTNANFIVSGTLSAGTIEASNISGTVGDTSSGVKAVYFENTENDSTHYTDKSGILAFDENFYADTEYGTGTYDPDATFVGGNGGGLLIKNEDGWGAIFTSQNTRWAKGYWNSLDVSGGVTASSVTASSFTTSGLAVSTFLGVAPGFQSEFIYTRGLVNQPETGTGPAAIIFGNGSTTGNDQISLVTAGTTRLYINSAGSVGIGTTSPLETLDVRTGGIRFGDNLSNYDISGFVDEYGGITVHSTTGNLGYNISTSNSAEGWCWRFVDNTAAGPGNDYFKVFYSSGNYWHKGTNTSDRRMKTNFVSIDGVDALNSIIKLNPLVYNDKYSNGEINDRLKGGFIAQEVIDVIPHLVGYDEDRDQPNENGYATAYSLDYNGVFTYNVKATQEIYKLLLLEQEKVVTLESQLASVLMRLDALEGA